QVVHLSLHSCPTRRSSDLETVKSGAGSDKATWAAWCSQVDTGTDYGSYTVYLERGQASWIRLPAPVRAQDIECDHDCRLADERVASGLGLVLRGSGDVQV